MATRTKLRLVLLCFALALNLQAQGKGKGKGKKGGHAADTAAVSVSFTDSDRRAIRQWSQNPPPAGLPPGLAKRGELPPGLQKQLQRKGTLPPGLQKKISPFPVDLNTRLQPLPSDCGCDRVFLEGRAMILNRSTGIILDIFVLF